VKKIEAVIREEKLRPVTDALRESGVGGLTAYHVLGFGRETTRPKNYLFLPKIKLEIYCTPDQCDGFVSIIKSVCSTGELGDGKIVVTDLENIVRIRTAEEKEAAVI